MPTTSTYFFHPTPSELARLPEIRGKVAECPDQRYFRQATWTQADGYNYNGPIRLDTEREQWHVDPSGKPVVDPASGKPVIDPYPKWRDYLLHLLPANYRGFICIDDESKPCEDMAYKRDGWNDHLIDTKILVDLATHYHRNAMVGVYAMRRVPSAWPASWALPSADTFAPIFKAANCVSQQSYPGYDTPEVRTNAEERDYFVKLAAISMEDRKVGVDKKCVVLFSDRHFVTAPYHAKVEAENRKLICDAWKPHVANIIPAFWNSAIYFRTQAGVQEPYLKQERDAGVDSTDAKAVEKFWANEHIVECKAIRAGLGLT